MANSLLHSFIAYSARLVSRPSSLYQGINRMDCPGMIQKVTQSKAIFFSKVRQLLLSPEKAILLCKAPDSAIADPFHCSYVSGKERTEEPPANRCGLTEVFLL